MIRARKRARWHDTGKTKGEPKPSYGNVEMIQEGGAWKVGKQSWSDKPWRGSEAARRG